MPSGSLLPDKDLDHVFERTRGLWDDARGSRFFLTGGTGLFGAWLVESFQRANAELGLGARIVVLTRDAGAAHRRLACLSRDDTVTVHEGDVRNFEPPAGAFDFVLHAATESSAQRHPGDDRHMLETIVDGTQRVLELARTSGTRRFLMVSSGAVYGPQPPDVSHVAEDARTGPNPWHTASAYAEGKRAAETMCAIEGGSGQISMRAARCFAFVGPHLPLDAHFAIGNFIGDAIRGGPIRIRGDGTAIRSYMYMADLAIWLWTLLLHPAATGPYNVGSEHAISILETARTVASVCAPDVSVQLGQVPEPGAVPHRYVPCTARARQELSLQQDVDLPDAIGRTVGWLNQVSV